MGIDDGLTLRGRYRLREAHSGLILAEADNLITTAGKGLVGDILREASGFDTGLTYIALGTGTTTPTISDTQLVSESVRGTPTTATRSGNVVTLSRFFAKASVAIHIREVGIFGHSTATSTANSGILFSRTLFDFDNSAGTYDLIAEYDLTIG